ncbi:hypothetical protein Q8A73_023201 [Channa argus]|nr:hypothetical protein Q8A73_023201 [Channa argus]
MVSPISETSFPSGRDVVSNAAVSGGSGDEAINGGPGTKGDGVQRERRRRRGIQTGRQEDPRLLSYSESDSELRMGTANVGTGRLRALDKEAVDFLASRLVIGPGPYESKASMCLFTHVFGSGLEDPLLVNGFSLSLLSQPVPESRPAELQACGGNRASLHSENCELLSQWFADLSTECQDTRVTLNLLLQPGESPTCITSSTSPLLKLDKEPLSGPRALFAAQSGASSRQLSDLKSLQNPVYHGLHRIENPLLFIILMEMHFISGNRCCCSLCSGFLPYRSTLLSLLLSPLPPSPVSGCPQSICQHVYPPDWRKGGGWGEREEMTDERKRDPLASDEMTCTAKNGLCLDLRDLVASLPQRKTLLWLSNDLAPGRQEVNFHTNTKEILTWGVKQANFSQWTYQSTIESVLRYGCTVWFSSCTAEERKDLRQIINTYLKIHISFGNNEVTG